MGNLLFQQARDAVSSAVSCSSGAEQQELVIEQKTLCTLLMQTLQLLKKFSYVKCRSNCKTLRIRIKKGGPALVLLNLF